MLPGRISPTREFVSEGFFAMMGGRFPEVDVVAADLHLAYFRNGTMVDRLHSDVVRPARGSGKREIWLVGVSLGGLGATIYAIERPEDVDRVVLLSPYLGEEEIIAEIEAAGGLAEWEPGEIADGDNDRRLWGGLKGLASRGEGKNPQFWLGYADGDRFTRANALFSRELMGGERTFTVPGGHDWPEWRALFGAILDDPTFADWVGTRAIWSPRCSRATASRAGRSRPRRARRKSGTGRRACWSPAPSASFRGRERACCHRSR